MLYIRQGATHKVVVGPAVAVANGYVPVTNLTLSGADEAEVILHDNGTVVDISGYTWAAITTADGYYHLTLQSGISNTVGHMTVVVNDDSLILPLRADFTVVEEAVYDQLFASSAPGAATVAIGSDIHSSLVIVKSDLVISNSDTTAIHTQTTTIASDVVLAEAALSDIESSLVIVKSDLVISNSDTTAIHLQTTTIASDVVLAEAALSDIESSLVIAKSDLVLLTAPGDGTAGVYPEWGIIDQGTAQAYTHATPSLTLRAAAAFGTDTLTGCTALIYGSTQGYWQAATIASSSGDVATLSAALEVEATGTISYKIFGTAAGSSSALTATQSSQLTRIQSDLIIAQSDLIIIGSDLLQVYSDTTRIHSDLILAEAAISDVESSLVIVKSDLVISNSDTTAIHTQTTTIASDLVQVYSDTTRIDSNTVLAETNISDIESSLVIIKSDLVVLESMVSDVESSLVIVKSDLVISNSDTTAIQTKTDQLTFTVANQVDANTESINASTVLGDGSAGDLWRGA